MAKIICTQSEYDKLKTVMDDNPQFLKDVPVIYDIVKDVPQVTDVQSVKQGRWIKQEGFWNKDMVKCSLCGNYLDMNGVNGGRGDANFCPNCGKIMMNDGDVVGKVNERDIEVSKPDGNCLDCKFQYLEDSDYWCSICPGNPEDI